MNGLDWYRSIKRSPIEEQAFDVKLDVALEVERIMEQLGLNRAQLAIEMGTSAPYVSKILQGDANLSIDSLVKIAVALNKQVEIHFRSKRGVSQWFHVIDGGFSRTGANTHNYFGKTKIQQEEAAHVEAA